jgi:pilus assembly protein Flp/PilA
MGAPPDARFFGRAEGRTLLTIKQHPPRSKKEELTMTTQTKQTRKSMRKNRGQGMTEYIIIVALIAIAAIGVITLFGDNIRRLFGMSSDALGGDDNIAQRNTTKASAAVTDKTMKNFGQNNTYTN